MNTPLKEKLHSRCLELVQERMARARQAMESAQAAANEEGKSSAGDKYETGRAMMQRERDQHARSLVEAQKLKQALDGIDPFKSGDQIQLGSLALTSIGHFYIAISLGSVSADGAEYMAISPLSPIGALLMGKKKGESIVFNKKKIEVLEVV